MYEQYSSQEFEKKYTYSGNLGAFWTPEKTTFRLWAPTTGAVSIRLYRSGDPGADDLLAQLRMQPPDGGAPRSIRHPAACVRSRLRP